MHEASIMQCVFDLAFAQLPDESGEVAAQVGPWTRRLIGVAGPASEVGDDVDVRQQHREYLDRKYA